MPAKGYTVGIYQKNLQYLPYNYPVHFSSSFLPLLAKKDGTFLANQNNPESVNS